MTGEMIRHFRVDAAAVEGGMGLVHRAFDTRLHRPVALKILRKELTASDEARQRFTHEARAAARLSHPNIATVHESFEHDGQLVVVTEWIEGKSLAVCDYRAPETWGEALDVLRQVADGLDAAHAAGVIHRDIKPSNIMIGPNGRVKICDFGVAHITDSTTSTLTGEKLIGTPSCMAPEQWEGKPIDHRVDLFALGILAYELLTGRRPFEGDTLEAVAYQVIAVRQDPMSRVNPEIPSAADAAIEKLLAKAPDDRPETACAAISTLSDGLTGTPADAFRRQLAGHVKSAIGVVAIVGVAAVVWNTFVSPGTNHRFNPVQEVQAAQPGQTVSLAIMPVTTAADALEASFNAAGLNETIGRLFRQFSGFKVISAAAPRTGESAGRGASDSTAHVVADFALSLAIDTDGEKHSLKAELSDSRTDRAVWTSEYTQLDPDDFARVAERILLDLYQSLGWKLSPQSYDRIPPSATRWIDRGLYYMNHDDPVRAERMFDSAVAAAPDHLELLYYKGLACEAQDATQRAIESFELALPDAYSPSATAWDTVLTRDPHGYHSTMIMEDGQIFAITYNPQQGGFNYIYFDPASKRTLSGQSALTEGLPVPLELSRSKANGLYWSGWRFDTLLNVRCRIIDSAGRTFGVTPEIRVSRENAVKWDAGVLWVWQEDSLLVFDSTAQRLGALPLPDRTWYTHRSTVGLGSDQVVRLGDSTITVYRLRPFGIAQRIDLSGRMGDWRLNGDTLAVCVTNPLRLVVYSTTSWEELWHIALPVTTGAWDIVAFASQGTLALRSNRDMIIARPSWIPFRDPIREYQKYPTDITTGHQNDSLWIAQKDGRVELWDLRSIRLIEECQSDTIWTYGPLTVVTQDGLCVVRPSYNDDPGGLTYYGGSPLAKLWEYTAPVRWSYSFAVSTATSTLFFTDYQNQVTEISTATGKVLSKRDVSGGRGMGSAELLKDSDDRIILISFSHRGIEDIRISRITPTAPRPSIVESEIRLHLWKNYGLAHERSHSIRNLLTALERSGGASRFLHRDLRGARDVRTYADSMLWLIDEAYPSFEDYPFARQYAAAVAKGLLGIELMPEPAYPRETPSIMKYQEIWAARANAPTTASGVFSWQTYGATFFGDTECTANISAMYRPLQNRGSDRCVGWIEFDPIFQATPTKGFVSPRPIRLRTFDGPHCSQLPGVALECEASSGNWAIDGYLATPTTAVVITADSLPTDPGNEARRDIDKGLTPRTAEIASYDLRSGTRIAHTHLRGHIRIPIEWCVNTNPGSFGVLGYKQIGLFTGDSNHCAMIIDDSLYLYSVPRLKLIAKLALDQPVIAISFAGNLCCLRNEDGTLTCLHPGASPRPYEVPLSPTEQFGVSGDVVIAMEGEGDPILHGFALPSGGRGTVRHAWSRRLPVDERFILDVQGERVLLGWQSYGSRREGYGGENICVFDATTGRTIGEVNLPFAASLRIGDGVVYGRSRMYFRGSLSRLMQNTTTPRFLFSQS